MLVHAFAGLGSVLFLPLWCLNEAKELFTGSILQFKIWLICRYIHLAPDQCWPTFYGFVTYKYCIQVVHGPAIQRTRDPNIEGAGGVRNVRARVAVFKILWKFF